MGVRQSRQVDGVLVLNKPIGISSNGALQRVKRIFAAAKAGHTGSLDPLATGVLPICFGEATKLSQFLLDSDKVYVVTIGLGITTDSGDADGRVLITASAAGIRAEHVDAVLPRFRGDLQQVPPMYSALKRDGVPLYAMARKGQVVERQPRDIRIHELERLDFRDGELAKLTLRVGCSKGTYIRVLAEDIGAALGCGGYVLSLHRIKAGPFTEDQAVGLERLESLREAQTFDERDALLMAPEVAAQQLPICRLEDADCQALLQGRALGSPPPGEPGLTRVVNQDNRFFGIAELLNDGRLVPRRMVATTRKCA